MLGSREHQHRTEQPGADRAPPVAPADLTGYFGPPRWLRDLGMTAWLAVGVTLAVIGVIWLLSLTNTIVAPVITASVIAAVASPVLALLSRHGVPRGLGTALLILGALVLAIAF